MGKLAKQSPPLASLTIEEVREMVVASPTKSRSVLGGALNEAKKWQHAHGNFELARQFAALVVANRWHLGKETEGRIHPAGKESESGLLRWLDFNVTKQDGQRAQQLFRKYPKFEQLEKRLNSIEEYATVHAALSDAHVSKNSGEMEWYTPPEYIEAARRAMGGIDLDPASCKQAQRTVKAKRYYTAEQDGLSKKWKGRVWLNPPYAQPLVTQFCQKLLVEVEAGNVTQACLLINNATETTFGQQVLKACGAVCFPAGRLQFLSPNKESSQPLQGQMLCYFGRNFALFASSFQEMGCVRF